MSRGQQTFKQSDVTRALKATVKAGIAVERVEIDKDGRIVIVSARAQDANQLSAFEQWKQGRAH
jgi:DNA-binding MarR family transcriptional regulator